MATIDLTVVRPYDTAGVRQRRIGLLTGDASYLQANGDTITPSTLKLGTIEFFVIPTITDGSNIYWPGIAYSANGSIVITWYSATGTQVGNGNLSTFSGRFEAIGY